MKSLRREQEIKDFFESIEEKKEEKFNIIYDKYKSLVKKVAFSVVKNESESEDIVQMVFIKIYNMSPNVLPIKNEMNWLYKVTKNLAIDYIKKNKSTVNIENIYSLEDSQNVLNSVVDNVAYNQIISNLPKKEQEVVSLKVISGLSFKQIGELLNMPTSTVSWIYYKSMKTLKLLLSNLFMTIITFVIYVFSKSNIPRSNGNVVPINEISNTIESSVNINKYIIINNIFLIIAFIFFIITIYFSIIFIKSRKKKSIYSSK